MTEQSESYCIVVVNGQRYGLPLKDVQRVIRAVHITALYEEKDMKVILSKINMLVSLFLILLLSMFSSTTNAKEVEKKGLRAAGCKTEYYLLHELAKGFKSKKILILRQAGPEIWLASNFLLTVKRTLLLPVNIISL